MGGSYYSVKISGAQVSLVRIELFGLVRVAKSGAETLGSAHQTNGTELYEGQPRSKGTTKRRTGALARGSRMLATKPDSLSGDWKRGADLRSRHCVEVAPPLFSPRGFFLRLSFLSNYYALACVRLCFSFFLC